MISIIIPTCNRDEMLNITLAALVKEISKIDAEIIVVNDAVGRTPVISSDLLENVVLLNNPKKSVGAARNFGVNNSNGEYIIFLDDDFLISRESILALGDLLNSHPDKVFNGAWIYPPELLEEIRKTKFGRYLISEGFTSLRERMKGLNWDETQIFERTGGLSSGILAITRNNFYRTGGYLEDMVFGNDSDFSLRVKAAGLKIYIAPQVIAYHNEIDKINLKRFMERRRYGISQLVKHKMVQKPNYSKTRNYLLKTLSRKKMFLEALVHFIPNTVFLDKGYKFFINVLLAVYLFEAYTEKK